MKRAIQYISFLMLVILLSGCNLPSQAGEPTVDLVSTQVARLQTESAAAEEIQTATETLTPPTETEAVASPTTTQTNTVTPTATLEPGDPAQQLGSPAWTQDFSGSTSAWDFDYPQATFQTSGGYLNLVTKANANWHSWYVSSPKLQDAYVEATIKMSSCSGSDRFGLAVRASSDGQQFYYMGITCSGQWGFFRMAPDVEIYEIKGYQNATQLSNGTDQPHRIGIRMDGSSFTFYIDGEEVGTASDSTLTGEGYTGFLIAFANNPGFTTQVDTLRYWNIP
ncbi:MAG: hypothetical protein H0S79_03090 [Anaerolineaceae bacterium]|nr:hypothetical protein [Anaerolineaceae bacterium]